MESHSGKDTTGEPEVTEQGTVVKWAISQTCQESRSDWFDDGEGMEDHHPEVVCNLECSEQGMLRVLSLADLK